MNCTSRLAGGASQLGCALLLLCQFSPVLGQDSSPVELEQQLQQIDTTLTTLDAQAEACLSDLRTGTTAISSANCTQFMESIDGSPVADYLNRCQQLEQWREQFVRSHATANRANTNGNVADSVENIESVERDERNDTTARDLQRLVDIEFYCADDSLRQRTSHVFNAFTAVRQARGGQRDIASRPMTAPIQQTPTDISQRTRALQERVRQETEQRWQQLQLDLLRQQSRQPVDYGLIP